MCTIKYISNTEFFRKIYWLTSFVLWSILSLPKLKFHISPTHTSEKMFIVKFLYHLFPFQTTPIKIVTSYKHLTLSKYIPKKKKPAQIIQCEIWALMTTPRFENSNWIEQNRILIEALFFFLFRCKSHDFAQQGGKDSENPCFPTDSSKELFSKASNKF